MGRRAMRVAIAASVAVLTAGCGTTVSTVTAPTAAEPGGDSLSVPSTGGTSARQSVLAPGGTTAAAGPGAAGALGGSPAGATSTSTGTVPAATPPSLATTSTGQLVVPLGVVYLKGLDQAY